MTSKERVRRAISHRAPDRVPARETAETVRIALAEMASADAHGKIVNV